MAQSQETVALYVRIPSELRARIDARIASEAGDKPWQKMELRQAVITALDEWAGHALINLDEPNGKNGKTKRVRK